MSTYWVETIGIIIIAICIVGAVTLAVLALVRRV